MANSTHNFLKFLLIEGVCNVRGVELKAEDTTYEEELGHHNTLRSPSTYPDSARFRSKCFWKSKSKFTVYQVEEIEQTVDEVNDIMFERPASGVAAFVVRPGLASGAAQHLVEAVASVQCAFHEILYPQEENPANLDLQGENLEILNVQVNHFWELLRFKLPRVFETFLSTKCEWFLFFTFDLRRRFDGRGVDFNHPHARTSHEIAWIEKSSQLNHHGGTPGSSQTWHTDYTTISEADFVSGVLFELRQNKPYVLEKMFRDLSRKRQSTGSVARQ